MGRNKSTRNAIAKSVAKANKVLLSQLPYYNCSMLENDHSPFNSLTNETSRRSLEHLCSLYDLSLFNLNTRNDIDNNHNENFLLTKTAKSKYFSPMSFKKSLPQYISSSTISIAHNNIRSLKKNFEEFQNQVLSELNIEFNVIGLSETRICISENANLIPSLPGYCFEYAPTPLSAGGVGFYINNNLKYRIINRTSNIHFQALWIESLNVKDKNIICGVVYRQHNNAEVFLEYLSNILEDFSRKNKNIFVMGDFNIDLLHYESCSFSQSLLDLTQSLSFFPTIDKLTRVYGNSATLIDNIFSNDLDSFQLSGNIVSDVSDHFVQVYFSTSNINSFIDPQQNTKIRDYSNFDENKFINELQNVDWMTIASKNDVNLSFSHFYKKFNALVNKHAPLKKPSRRKLKSLSKPWITKGIKIAINKKHNYLLRGNKELYKRYRNKLTSLIRISKKNYYLKFFESNIKKSKEIWKGIMNLLQ